jgi:hypothetical protein
LAVGGAIALVAGVAFVHGPPSSTAAAMKSRKSGTTAVRRPEVKGPCHAAPQQRKLAVPSPQPVWNVPRLLLGLVAGIVYGALSAASMLPLTFPDKRAALTGAFINRLTIGLVVGAVIGAPQVSALGVPAWLVGTIIGLMLSAADAVITKAYAPILILGALGGAVIGWLVGRFGSAS